MTQDPKKLPNWMRGKQPPPENPPEPPGDSAGDGEAELPPWLREDAPAEESPVETPPEPRIKRVKPPEETEGEVPPWLAGADEPPTPKTYKIGGMEFSEEFLSAAEELPDSDDSGMTFDSWMAERIESTREKDIEEEVPEDLLASLGGDVEPAKSTGQLPDWFLGLEALDTTEAPEWFSAEDEPPPASAAPPTWISDLIEADAPPEEDEDELPSADEIGSFFSSIGAAEEEETPEIDWYDQSGEEVPQTPGDDFFAQLVGSSGTSAGYEEDADYEQVSPLDEFVASRDLDEDDTPTEPRGSVEIPQNELDAFFSGLVSERSQPISMDEIEDPDLEWVVDESRVVDEPAAYEPPETPAASVEESNNWLSELQHIVSGATRPLPPVRSDDDELIYPGATTILEPFETTTRITDSGDDDFVWPEHEAAAPEPAPETPEAEDAPDTDWLRSLSPPEDATDESPVSASAPPSLRSRLTDRLNRAPEPAEEQEETASSWDDVMNAAMPGTDSFDAPAAPEISLFGDDEPAAEAETASESLSGNDDAQLEDAFTSEPLFGDDAQLEDAFTSESLFGDDDAELEDAFASESLFGNDEQQPSDAFTSESLFGDDDAQPEDAFASESLYGEPVEDQVEALDQPVANLPDFAAADDNEAFAFDADALFAEADQSDNDEILPAAELQTGWLNDALLSPDEDAADDAGDFPDIFDAPEAESLVDLFDEDYPDLFGERADSVQAAPEMTNDAPLDAGWQQDEPDADDFYATLYPTEDAGEAADLLGALVQPGEDEPGADDFYATLNATEDAEEAADFLAALDLPGESEAADEAELYPAFGADEDDEQAATDDAELAGSWWNEQENASRLPQTSEFLAGLSFEDAAEPTDGEPDAGGWLDEAETETNEPRLPQTSEFLAGLSFEDSIGEPGEQDTTEADDFFAALGEEAGTEALAEELDEVLYNADMPQTGDLLGAYNNYPSDAMRLNEPESAGEAADEDTFFSVLDIASDVEPHEVAEEPALFSDWQVEAGSEDDAELPAADETPESEDFFAALGMSQADDELAEALPVSDALFSEWLDEEQPADESGEVVAQSDDFFSAMGMGDGTGAAQDDALAGWETEGDVPPAEDFFAALGMIDKADAAEPAAPDDADEMMMPDYFSSLDDEDDDPEARTSAPEMPFSDVDSYLASLSSEPTADMTESSFEQDGEIDLDALFSEAMSTQEDAPLPGDMLPGANEDWLLQMQASVDEVSASAIVRQQEDRPTEELSDRLKKLRERAEEIPDEVADTGSGGINAAAGAGVGSLVQGVALTPEQQQRVELLRGIAPKEGRAQPFRMSAIDATYDSPFMPELEDTPETTVQPVRRERREKTRRKTRRRLNIRFDRFFVALALAAAVIAPFIVPGFRVGTLPPDNFAANSDAQNAFNQVHSLQSGDLVLVAVEYGAASAGELDGVTDALLRHILLRSAFPVIVSGNAVGLLRAETRLEALSQDEAFLERIGSDRPLQANQDYYVVRYLPGSVIGLRAFSQDTANLLLADIRGQATNLQVRSLNDFALVTVITDRAEDLRAYAEQVAPLTRSPMMAAVSYSAAPLAEPYMQALGGGLLVGYADAYTYGDLIETVTARDISARVRIVPTLEPTPTVQAAAAESEATPTPRPTRRAATPTPQPTAAPDMATVSADQTVNMRGGAGTDFPVLAAVPSGTVLVVLGYNDDQSWVNVVLDDGREGWIAASLLTIQTSQSAAPKLTIYSKRQVIEEGEEDETPTPTLTRTPTSTRTPLPSETPIGVATDEQADETSEAEASVTATRTATARPTRTPLPSATPTPTEQATEQATEEATAEVTAEATEAVVVAPLPPPPPSPGYRDERWYAMNMGIIASALIITLGMVINLVRGLLRRGRRG